jgi:hypothetical protein
VYGVRSPSHHKCTVLYNTIPITVQYVHVSLFSSPDLNENFLCDFPGLGLEEFVALFLGWDIEYVVSCQLLVTLL